jgi:hypothetical protein
MSVSINCLNTVTVSDQITENIDVGPISLPAQGTSKATYPMSNGTSTSGTVASVVDVHWELSGDTAVTLAGGSSVTYTLSALTDSLTRSLALARLRKAFVWLIDRVDGDYLNFGQAATHPVTIGSTQAIPVFDCLLIVATNAAGIPVGSGSSDQLKIANPGSNPITFGINLSGDST